MHAAVTSDLTHFHARATCRLQSVECVPWWMKKYVPMKCVHANFGTRNPHSNIHHYFATIWPNLINKLRIQLEQTLLNI